MAKQKKRSGASTAKAKRRESRKRKQATLLAGRDPVQGAWRLPLVGCFVNRGWRERHMASVMVFRDRGQGRLVMAGVLVDLGCLGVKDAWVRTDMDFMEYEELVAHMRGFEDPGESCEVELAVAILLAGRAYASSLGFEPHNESERVLQVLGSPSADAVLPEVPCGEDGKPLYIAGPDDDVEHILGTLEQRLGPEGFHFIAPAGALDDMPPHAGEVTKLLDELAHTSADDRDSLLLRCGKLKRCLILWSMSGELLGELRDFARGQDSGDGQRPEPDEILDRFIAAHRFDDGRSVHEAFVDRFSQLGDDDRRIILGWKDTVDGIFEIIRHAGDHLELVNLVDDLPYVVRSNLGPAGLKQAPKKGFLIGRMSRLGDEWLLSGEHRVMKPRMADALLTMAAELAMKIPRLFFRNPAHLENGWEQQQGMYDDFVAHFGSDEVVLPGSELQAAMDGFMARQQRDARERTLREGTPLDPALVSAAPISVPIPPELLCEREVAALHHPRWGQGFYVGYGEVRRAYLMPKRGLRRSGLRAVRDYLEDPDIDPLPLIQLGERYPEAASVLFASIVGRPGFDWRRDGDALLREYKGDQYDRLQPRVVPLPERYVAAMRRTAETRGR